MRLRLFLRMHQAYVNKVICTDSTDDAGKGVSGSGNQHDALPLTFAMPLKRDKEKEVSIADQSLALSIGTFLAIARTIGKDSK